MNTDWVSSPLSLGRALQSRKEWFLAFIFAALAGMILLISSSTGSLLVVPTIIFAVPAGIWLVVDQPIWAIVVYLLICASPFFGIHDYIEPGKYAAAALLLLLFLRELAVGGIAASLGKLFKPYLAVFSVFCISSVVALLYHNSPSAWAREQAQYLPILLGPIVARNLRSRRQVLSLVIFCAATAVIALPFEAYQFLLARAPSFKILTGEEFTAFARLPLPHFSVLNAGTFSALLGSWLLVPKSRFWRVVNYALAAIVPAAMFVAQSRIWTAMAILALLLPFVLWARRDQLLKLVPKLVIFCFLVLAVLFVAYKGLETVSPDIADTLAARLVPLQFVGEDQSIGIRWQGAQYLAKVAAESPIVGHGLGYAVSLAPWEWAQSTSSVSGFDNAHLALLIKFGILGAFIFYWLFWKLGREAYQDLHASRLPLDIVVSATFLSGLICLLLVGFSYSALNVFENTNFLGIWSGMVIYLRRQADRKQSI